MAVQSRRVFENDNFALGGRKTPLSLRRTNYLTNSELEYSVKKDLGCRVEPYGLVPAIAQKQRRQGLKYLDSGNARLDFLARQLDLVTAELNESIGRVSHKKLRQIMDKLNVLRSQMNLARYEEELRPRKLAIMEQYSPRVAFNSSSPRPATATIPRHKGNSRKLYATQTDPMNMTSSSDFEAVEGEMRRFVDDDQPQYTSSAKPPLRRVGSANDLRRSVPTYDRADNHRLSYGSSKTDDLLNLQDPLVREYFPATARFQSEQFSAHDQAYQMPSPRYQRPPVYDPLKYTSASNPSVLNSNDIVDAAEQSGYDPATFQLELLRLKAQKLQLEEEALLEMRRLSELERLRAPLPKWYSLKTPQFWYEASKNNDRVRKPYDSVAYNNYIDNYRQTLVRASTAFENKWSSRKY